MQTLTLNIPGGSIRISGDHETEIIKKAAFWQSIPEFCPICKSALRFNYRTPQTFEYYELVCSGSPEHSINFGEKKGTHDLYFDNKKSWKAYNPGRIDDDDDRARVQAAASATIGANNAGEPFALSPPAAAHDNAPGTMRGKMIARIIELRSEAIARNVKIPDFKPEHLGGFETDSLKRLGEQLAAAFKTAA